MIFYELVSFLFWYFSRYFFRNILDILSLPHLFRNRLARLCSPSSPSFPFFLPISLSLSFLLFLNLFRILFLNLFLFAWYRTVLDFALFVLNHFHGFLLTEVLFPLLQRVFSVYLWSFPKTSLRLRKILRRVGNFHLSGLSQVVSCRGLFDQSGKRPNSSGHLS